MLGQLAALPQGQACRRPHQRAAGFFYDGERFFLLLRPDQELDERDPGLGRLIRPRHLGGLFEHFLGFPVMRRPGSRQDLPQPDVVFRPGGACLECVAGQRNSLLVVALLAGDGGLNATKLQGQVALILQFLE